MPLTDNSQFAIDLPIQVRIIPRLLHFKNPAGTSRGIYLHHRVWYVLLTSPANHSLYGLGECAPLHDLSAEYDAHYETFLHAVSRRVEQSRRLDREALRNHPSVLFGFETAFLSARASLRGESHLTLLPTPFSLGQTGIPINGLVWMGTYEEMRCRMQEKLHEGFRCIKIKIGAIDFNEEIRLLRLLRQDFSPADLQLRVDANGAFSPEEAPARLRELSAFGIHSIEQPIRPRQWDAMARLCRESPIPIALDEELIGVNHPREKERLLRELRPQYLVLKPTLHGGMAGTEEWMRLSARHGIPYWVTSALESNVGLNAVAQLTAYAAEKTWRENAPENTAHLPATHGLGTGQLYLKNYTATRLVIKSGVLHDLTLPQSTFAREVEEFKREWHSPAPFLTVHTSGSTGTPRPLRVLKTHMSASAQKTCRFLGLQPGDTALLCLPLQYIAGKMMVVRSLVSHLRLLAVCPTGRPFAQLHASPVFAALTPFQVSQTLKSPRETTLLRGVRHLIIGGGPISPQLESALADFPNNVWSTYGMTETLSHIALRRVSGPHRSQRYTALPGVTLQTDQRHCLVITSPDIGAHCLATNDIAQLSPDASTFLILGRCDNVVCSGGLKHQVEELEARLQSSLPSPFFLTGVPDAVLGEALTLVCQAPPTQEALLRERCRAKLTRHEMPKHIVFLPCLPMTETGKPARAEIKRRAMEAMEAMEKNKGGEIG